MTTLGVIFPPDRPPEELRGVAVAADRAGVEQLWLWEDCFKESAISAAAATLAWTDRLVVGIGLLPVPLRNVALTAMELATLERLFPGRLVPGVGHGILDWMGQVGARVSSPMTLLREYTTALRDLLHGQKLTTEGRYIQLTDVQLDWPPSPPPSLLVGAGRERTVRLAGELGDGVILAGEAEPSGVRKAAEQVHTARASAGRSSDTPADIVAFTAVEGGLGATDVAARVDEYAHAGATHVALLAVGDGPPLADYATFLGQEVRALVA